MIERVNALTVLVDNLEHNRQIEDLAKGSFGDDAKTFLLESERGHYFTISYNPGRRDTKDDVWIFALTLDQAGINGLVSWAEAWQVDSARDQLTGNGPSVRVKPLSER
jgi:hypothetical protein